jgi:hypothetical protein
MVSTLDNWDGSLSSAAKQDPSRTPDFAETAGASILTMTTTETLGNGWHDMATSQDMVRCLLYMAFVFIAQIAVCSVRRVGFDSTPIA